MKIVSLIAFDQDHDRRRREARAQERKARTGWVGPQVLYYPPVLREGDSARVYLEAKTGSGFTGKVYQPAAHQYSFEPMP